MYAMFWNWGPCCGVGPPEELRKCRGASVGPIHSVTPVQGSFLTTQHHCGGRVGGRGLGVGGPTPPSPPPPPRTYPPPTTPHPPAP